jgi:lysophospholipase L1-like esterase
MKPTPVPNATGPTISCPAVRTVLATDGRAASVDYPLATAEGGAPPLSVVCTPSSGASFPVGSTPVACVASDSLRRTAACSFSVAVQAPPRVSGVTYTAFGDSITEGLALYRTATAIPSPIGSYPARLHFLLSSRYAAQTILVYDEGIGGETVVQGMNRLRPVLIAEHPDALLLLEGINDLNGGGSKQIPTVVDGLKAMVQEGRSRGATVFLGTLLPQRAGGQRAYAPELVRPTNEQIRAMAEVQGAVLVDVYAAFGGDAGSLIGDDGLHPNDAGKLRIAEAFFAAIRSRLEMPMSFGPLLFRSR